MLARQLSNPDLALAARAALERIPGEESLAALRAALPGATGALRQGLISSLGARRGEQAVRLLAGLLPGSADALAAIGTQQALEALQAARPQPSAALLRCALQLRAVAVLEKLSAADQPKAIRVAAFIGRVNVLGDQGGEATLAALAGHDPALQVAAIGLLRGGDRADALAAHRPHLLRGSCARRSTDGAGTDAPSRIRFDDTGGGDRCSERKRNHQHPTSVRQTAAVLNSNTANEVPTDLRNQNRDTP